MPHMFAPSPPPSAATLEAETGAGVVILQAPVLVAYAPGAGAMRGDLNHGDQHHLQVSSARLPSGQREYDHGKEPGLGPQRSTDRRPPNRRDHHVIGRSSQRV